MRKFTFLLTLSPVTLIYTLVQGSKQLAFITVSVLLFLLSCDESSPIIRSDGGVKNTAPPKVFVNSSGDTVPSGVPIPVKGKAIKPESLSAPKITPVKSSKKIPALKNKYPAGTPQVNFIDKEKLRIVTPGKNGVPLPEKVQMQKERLIAKQPEPIAALPPAFKDVATYDIRYLDIDQGLGSSYFETVYEDSRGYYWFSDWTAGACRYDGASFTYFTTEHGLVSNEVYFIYEDSGGNMWFGTGAGVSKYDGFTFTNYTGAGGFEYDTGDIFEDRRGYLWITTLGGGVNRYDPKDDSFTHFTADHGLLHNRVRDGLEDRDGNIWFTTDKGLSCYDGKSFIGYSKAEGLPTPIMYYLMEDEQGILWIGTRDGLSSYDGETFTNYGPEQGFNNAPVKTIIKDWEGHLWLAGGRKGITKYDGSHFTELTIKEGLTIGQVLDLFKDSRDQIWMATYGAGINIFSQRSFQHHTIIADISPVVVDHVFRDSKENLWFSTGGAVRFDGAFYHYYTEEDGLGGNEVIHMMEDPKGNIWMSVIGDGLTKFNGQTFTHYNDESGLSSETIMSLCTDREGNIWIATRYDGIAKFDGTSFTHFTENEGVPDEHVLCIMGDADGNIWFGTKFGATKFDGHTFTHFTSNEGLPDNKVFYIFQDSHKNYWFSTSNGLCKYDGFTFENFYKEDGFNHDALGPVIEDYKGNLWIGSPHGINLMEFSTEKQSAGKSTTDFQIRSFKWEDGLKAEKIEERGVSIDRHNQIWWATGKCVSSMDLNQFYTLQNEFVPKVYLNNIYLNGAFVDFSSASDSVLNKQKVTFSEKAAFQNYPFDLKVPYKLNHFTFDFIAIDGLTPHSVRYQYQLTGLEDGWSRLTDVNKVDYRSLPFGSYTFKVKARSKSGIWSEPFEFPFTVRPPWWYTKWAFFIYFLALLGLGFLVFSFLKKRWLLQNRLKREQEEALRLKELDHFKSKLYTNLTHEFRTPLTVILGMARQIRNKPRESLDEGTRLIEVNGKNLLRLINQLLDLSKLENKSFRLNLQQADIIPYLRYLTESFHSYANGKNLSLRFFTSVEALMMDYDVEQIKQILTNLISNAIKFTPPEGAVNIRISKKNEHVDIEVQDTGIGISQKDLPHIFDRFYQVDSSTTREREGTGIGLAHTKELVHVMEGKITVKSTPGKGTRFTVGLPIRREANVAETMIEKSAISVAHPSERKADALSISENKKTETVNLPQLLIIEDNPDVVVYLKACLENLYQIIVAYNGKIGIEKALESVPDLIISDVMMPEKDGYEVCDRLKNDERTSHIPIILLTAKADASSKLTGLKRGADAYLSKPFDKEELLVRLEKMLALRIKMRNYFTSAISPLPTGTALKDDHEAIAVENTFIQKIKNILEQHIGDEDFGLPQLCQKVGMSRSQLFRKMKALTNTAPSSFIKTYRLNKAKYLLENSEMNVAEAAYAVGFSDPSYFSKVFQSEFGILPSTTSK